ncbi:MAG: NAD(P)H-hydrate dehydratase [Nitrososphaerota archaeon]
MNLDRYRIFLNEEITSEDMAAIEENAESMGFDRKLMMENAGAKVADFIIENMNVEGKVALIVCGTGNNGGDGFVTARHLRNYGAKIIIVLLGKTSEIRTEEAKSNWFLIEKMEDVEKFFLIDISQIEKFSELLSKADFIIDAILGTGIKGNLREPIASIVNIINNSNKIVFAIDTPSGLNPSTGEIHGNAIKANYTITFHKMKKGLKGKEEYTGKIFVKEIGIPIEAEIFTGPGDVRRVIKPRKTYSHKGNYGYVLIIGGSEIFSGAPALAALSSLRTGAGLVYISAPISVANSIRQFSPDIIVYPFPHNHLTKESIDSFKELIEKVDAIVIGPGLGLNNETIEAIPEIIKEAKDKPIVLDADGFKAIKKCPEMLKGIVATPHAGEFKHVFGIEVGEKWWEKVDKSIEIAKEYEFVLVLKGHDTIITDGKRLKINRWGTPGMAVGGTGDVLSGILATFLAWKNDKFLSAIAATYIHGDAGKKAVEKKGFHILASDLINEIPEVLKKFDKEIYE